MFTLAFNTKEGLFLSYTGDTLNVHESCEQIVKNIETKFKDTCMQGPDWCFSTMMYYETMSPTVVEIPDTPEETMDILVSEESGVVVSVISSGAVGDTLGLQVEPEFAADMIAKGFVPKLPEIDDLLKEMGVAPVELDEVLGEVPLDLTTEAGVVSLMKSSKSEEEWNLNCDKVKDANVGYPSFWYTAIVMSGLAVAVQKGW